MEKNKIPMPVVAGIAVLAIALALYMGYQYFGAPVDVGPGAVAEKDYPAGDPSLGTTDKGSLPSNLVPSEDPAGTRSKGAGR